jgi:hypothetical protein
VRETCEDFLARNKETGGAIDATKENIRVLSNAAGEADRTISAVIEAEVANLTTLVTTNKQ